MYLYFKNVHTYIHTYIHGKYERKMKGNGVIAKLLFLKSVYEFP